MQQVEVSFVIPFCNKTQSICLLIDRIITCNLNQELILINNGFEDIADINKRENIINNKKTKELHLPAIKV